MMKIVLSFVSPSQCSRRESYLCEIVRAELTLACIQTFPTFCVMIENNTLYIFISVVMTLTFIQDHSCVRDYNLSVFFFPPEISLSSWINFTMLPQGAGLLKLMLNLFCINNIEGRELC